MVETLTAVAAVVAAVLGVRRDAEERVREFDRRGQGLVDLDGRGADGPGDGPGDHRPPRRPAPRRPRVRAHLWSGLVVVMASSPALAQEPVQERFRLVVTNETGSMEEELVLTEAAEGDTDAARARLMALEMITRLDTTEDAESLTQRLLALGAFARA